MHKVAKIKAHLANITISFSEKEVKMSYNLTTFFAYSRRAPFGGRLSTTQVQGVEDLLSSWRGDDPRPLAYVLATVFHETGGRMVPVREGFAANDTGARRVVAKRKYGKPDPTTGHVYYGRGHVQLTWAENYKSMGNLLGLPLYEQPDLALNPKISARILIEGMVRGTFTGKKLADYFGQGGVADPVGARRIINGTDKAKLIAGHYEAFLGALQAAKSVDPQPEDVTPAASKPDDVPPVESKSLLGAAGTFLGGASSLPFLGSISNPWALAAFALILGGGGIAAWLVLSGRITINRRSTI